MADLIEDHIAFQKTPDGFRAVGITWQGRDYLRVFDGTKAWETDPQPLLSRMARISMEARWDQLQPYAQRNQPRQQRNYR